MPAICVLCIQKKQPHLEDNDLEGANAQHEVNVPRHLAAALAEPPKALPSVRAALPQLPLCQDAVNFSRYNGTYFSISISKTSLRSGMRCLGIRCRVMASVPIYQVSAEQVQASLGSSVLRFASLHSNCHSHLPQAACIPARVLGNIVNMQKILRFQ